MSSEEEWEIRYPTLAKRKQLIADGWMNDQESISVGLAREPNLQQPKPLPVERHEEPRDEPKDCEEVPIKKLPYMGYE